VLTVVNLDPFNVQSGWLTLDGNALGLSAGEVYEVYDLLAERGYTWTGARNYVELRPLEAAAHVFEIRRRG
jgi:starch synthase (maltosyl-transferring)